MRLINSIKEFKGESSFLTRQRDSINESRSELCLNKFINLQKINNHDT